MKKKNVKKIIIGGEAFIYNNKLSNNNYFLSLDQCFNKCSYAKQHIYNYYYNLLSNNYNIEKYGVMSYNCHFIILNAIIKNKETNKKMYVKISPAHNYYIDVVED